MDNMIKAHHLRIQILYAVAPSVKHKKNECVGRESNPGQLLGRQLCSPLYHRRLDVRRKRGTLVRGDAYTNIKFVCLFVSQIKKNGNMEKARHLRIQISQLSPQSNKR